VRGQYPDGIRGPLIVHDPEDPHKDLYDEEIVLTFSDWYHEQMPGLLKGFISVANPSGAEPVPQAALMNDTQDLSIKVRPGKTYLFRMVNMGAFAAQYVWFEEHTMRVVEVDGVYTEPMEAEMLYLTAAQRYSVLITAKNDTSANFAIVGSMDQDLFDVIPDGLNSNVTGWLVYDDTKEKPTPKELEAFEPFDDFNLVPHDNEKLMDHVDQTITLDLKMDNLNDGAN
jgi:iron transport multicopper oxidase